MLLLVTATGCSSNSNKSDTDSKSTTSSIFSKKEDKYSVEAIEKRNFEEAKNIPGDDSFDILTEDTGTEYCKHVANMFYTEETWVLMEDTTRTMPSAVEIYCNDYGDIPSQRGKNAENWKLFPDNPSSYTKVGFIHFKETLSYSELKKEKTNLEKNVKKYFGEKALVDHSLEKNWTPHQYDNDIFSIKVAKAKSSSDYKVNDGDYQLDFAFNLKALKEQVGDLNTEDIKNGFIWLGLDSFYDSEHKCIDGFKMLYKQNILDIIPQLEGEEEQTYEMVPMDSFPIISVKKTNDYGDKIEFWGGFCHSPY